MFEAGNEQFKKSMAIEIHVRHYKTFTITVMLFGYQSVQTGLATNQ
jgi:hypothetical protein